MVAISDRQLLLALLKRVEPKLRSAFLDVVEWLRDRRSLTEITKLIQAARYADIVATDDLAAAASSLSNAIGEVYVAAGRELGKVLSEGLDVRVNLDATADRAIAALKAHNLRLVTGLTEEVRTNLYATLREGLRAGTNPRATARLIRSSIGLVPNQRAAVVNYRRLLETGSKEALDRELRDRRFDRTVARAAADGKPLAAKQIDSMVERYAARHLAQRAETIARTESLRAVHEGAEEMWRQAVDAEVLTADELIRTWRSAHDGRVRPSHRVMDGQVRALGQAFISGDGNALRYPCDPGAPASDSIRCRCLVVTRLEQDTQTSENDNAAAA